MKVRFTRPARSDLESIYAYVNRHDPKAAARIIDGIIERVEALGRHPYTGRPTDVANIRVAALPRYRYLIFYSIAGDELHILHVRHMSRAPWVGQSS